ncbi:uncharacterized protein LTR77_005890 [Saxophila tyrrhenica]|uniref:Uncharacterized protein n=1 Tax=Saxophila tyrrhenica TaxID=1690608 RepID=A0AAV9PCV8_9PEZI|nr:hypothetical protein LTR77_005890 [Saxophila tyrrhenica]
MGLPYWALRHFSDSVEATTFEEEYREYCLPVLDPQIITCTEEPFNQTSFETGSNLVRYEPLYQLEAADEDAPPITLYKIILDYPNDDPYAIKFRTNDEGAGTMVLKMHPDPELYNTSVIAASDDGPDGYASRLHRLLYGTEPDKSGVPQGSDYYFVAKCEFASIKYQDDIYSSWRQVGFTLKNGVLRANVTDERCANARMPTPQSSPVSGFADLYFTLEGAGAVLGSSDGYSKLFNLRDDAGQGSNIFSGMSRLDSIVNQVYHIVHTSWSESINKYAMKNQTIYDQPVIMTEYPHLYVIRIDWTPTTYIGLVLSILITANASVLAARWLLATWRFGFDAETWNLLTPVDLMAYSLAAYQDLIHHLNTVEHRRMAMRGATRTVLKERPLWEGTESLIGLVSNSALHRFDTSTAANPTSPTSQMTGKVDYPAITETAASSPISPTSPTGRGSRLPMDPEKGDVDK